MAEEVFDTPGADTWQFPAGSSNAVIETWGGGQAGESAAMLGGVGGEGGGYGKITIDEPDSEIVYSIQVGSGGAADGAAGTVSQFYSNPMSPLCQGGGGGAGEIEIGDVTAEGGDGASTGETDGGGGGAAGSALGNGANGSGTSGGVGVGGAGSGGGAATAGTQPGGGGGGSNAGGSGGAGGHGRVKITYDVASPALPPIFDMSYQAANFQAVMPPMSVVAY